MSRISIINQYILEYLKENVDKNSTYTDVLDLDFRHMLRYYLEWNGIIGYHEYIIDLIEYCLGNLDELEPHYDL